MTAELAFVDTETTGLDIDRHHIWEIAIIRATHHDDTLTVEERITLQPQLPGRAIAHADPIALKISGYHARRREDDWLDYTHDAARIVDEATRGRHWVGAVPDFDAYRLARVLKQYDRCPMWNYHLIDIEALTAGAITTAAQLGHSWHGLSEHEMRDLAAPPWRSDDLTAALGVTVDPDLRHTALGDADWAMRTYAAVHDLTVTGEDAT